MFLLPALAANASEAEYNRLFCRTIGGETGVYHTFNGGSIRVDCETASHVIESGLDKRSSLDSIQQAMFASLITGKTPAVILYDTDGKIGVYEYRIGQVAHALGITFLRQPIGADSARLAKSLLAR